MKDKNIMGSPEFDEVYPVLNSEGVLICPFITGSVNNDLRRKKYGNTIRCVAKVTIDYIEKTGEKEHKEFFKKWLNNQGLWSYSYNFLDDWLKSLSGAYGEDNH